MGHMFIFCCLVLLGYFIKQTTQQTCLSNQFLVNAICEPCNVACLTCNGTSSTHCTDCTATTRVYDSSAGTCFCADGYEQDTPVAANCIALNCHYSCLTCKNTVTSCKSCPVGSFRTHVPNNGTCPCNAKYYDANAATCLGCHYTCALCTGGSSTMCTSCNAVNFRQTDGAGGCKCMAKYYDNLASSELCLPCNRVCQTCQTSATNCLTCSANRMTAPTCACQQGFYDDGSSEDCKTCHYSCHTCTNSNSCTACNANTAFRGFVTSAPYCACLDRYFEAIPDDLICLSCHPTCLQCTGSNLDTACTACSSLANRQLNGNKCECRTGFFQTNVNVELCNSCDYRCNTCLTLSTTCTSCSSALFRQPVTTSCPCISGYYESSQTGLCTLCHSSCVTCTNASQCATCDTAGKGYSLNSSKLCSCDDVTYFNTTQNKCIACSITCLNCAQTSPTFCTTCAANRSLISNACPCLPFHFDSGISTCSPCHYSCSTCNGLTDTQCLSCSSTNFRLAINAGQCLCRAGFYDDGSNLLCQSCNYRCATCLDAFTCLTCDNAKFRQLPGSLCPCMTGYYQSSNFTCQKCAYYCVTCSVASICSTCNSPNRVMNAVTLKCDCTNGFFDDGIAQTCQPCLPQCKTCTNSSRCTSCQVSLFRSITASFRCPCITKYYDVAGTCTLCEYYCATCTAPTTCQACNSSANRIKDPVTNKCVCRTGFYDSGIQQCQKCSYACQNCLTTSINCISCDTTLRVFNTNWCDCRIKSYDNNVTTACPSCNYKCESCTNLTHCLSCDATKFRNFDVYNVLCSCIDKYYDDGASQLCRPCNQKCQTCTNVTQCQTCVSAQHRITPSSLCPCMIKYYDSGNVNLICLNCHYSCAACTNGTQCFTCQTTYHRTYDSVSKLCKCKDAFYDDGASNQLCQPCDYSCTTCSTTSTHCLSCSDSTTHRQLIINACPCQKRFFDQNLDAECQSCQYSCQTCVDATTCDTCDILKHREHNVTNDLCQCIEGYYDDLTNKQTCKKCDPSCLACTNGVSCSTCDAGRKRLLNSSLMYDGSSSTYCVCFYGHFTLNSSQSCRACHYSCQVCSGPANIDCLRCDNAAHRSLHVNLSRCFCTAGFYDNGSNQLCSPCDSACRTCFGPLSNQCNGCVNTKFLMWSQRICYVTCPNYYFGNPVDRLCTLCSPNCLKCFDSNTCTQCDTTYHLLQSDKKCYTNCPDGFWQNTPQKLCTICPTGCKTCASNVKCFDCIDHFYFDSSIQLCFSCNQFCKSCIGPAQDQCLSCYEPLFFRANKCRNLTCPYGQYVDSVLGCKNCIEKFANSLTCNKTQAFLCIDSFKLHNSDCKVCSDVDGYHITSLTKTCSEICGDGKLFDYQCDDGNQLDGDGCSKNCIIENGWKCSATTVGSISTCLLQENLSMKLVSVYKFSGQNKASLTLGLSLPYRLTNNFSIIIANISISDISWFYSQNQNNLSSVQLTIMYKKNIQGKKLEISYGSSRRLLQSKAQPVQISTQLQTFNHQNRLLTVTSISFDAQIQINTFPPVFYYSNTEMEFFQMARQIIQYLAIILLSVSLVVIPKKTHLHSFTFAFIVAKIWLIFGLALQTKLDWVNYVLHDIKSFAMIGGLSMGSCCHQMSSFYDYSTQLVSNSLYILIAWIVTWIAVGTLYIVHKFIKKIDEVLQYANYFAVTVHLSLIFPVFFASLNALHHYSINNSTEAFNITFSIAISIFCLVLVVLSWILTYNLQIRNSTSNQDKVNYPQKLISQNSANDPKQVENHIFDQWNDISRNSIFTSLNNQSVISEQNQVQLLKQSAIKKVSFIKDKQKVENNVVQDEKYTEISRKIQKISSAFILFDYESLYKTKRNISKYFLPITLTALYIEVALTVFLAPYNQLVFIVLLDLLQFAYFIYILIQRPFRSKFTNFRIAFVSLLFVGMHTVMAYYLKLSESSEYFKLGEVIFIYLCGITLLLCIVFSLLEHLISWKRQIWNIIQGLLISYRLRGIKKVYDMHENHKTRQIITVQEHRQVQKLDTQQIDEFYLRILKKDKLNKKYRKQRKMR